jgi:segregation and condensation protein B
MRLKQVLEALVFASQKPITPKEIVAALKSAAVGKEEDAEIQELAKTTEEKALEALEELRGELDRADRGYVLIEKVNGWQLVSNARVGHWVRQLFPESKPARLSGPALETLAIIAYRQPIMRADIEAVRGVAVDGVVQSLLERGLLRIAGRAEIPGRPLLYETTEFFLDHFGLKSVDELPNAGELRKMNLPTAASQEAEKAAAAEPPKAEKPPAPNIPIYAKASEPTAEAPADAPAGEQAVPAEGAAEPPAESSENAPSESSDNSQASQNSQISHAQEEQPPASPEMPEEEAVAAPETPASPESPSPEVS